MRVRQMESAFQVWRCALALAAIALPLGGAQPAHAAPAGEARLTVYSVTEDPSRPLTTLRMAAWDSGGHSIGGLGGSDFVLADAGYRVDADSVALVDDQPLSIVVVLDNTRAWIRGGDAGVNAETSLRDAALAFLDRLSGADADIRVGILPVAPAQPGALDPGRPRANLEVARAEVARLVHMAEDMPLRDRIVDGLRLLQEEDPGRRRVLLLVTDGNDVRSPVTYDQVLEAAQQGQVQVFAIGVAAQQAAQLRLLTTLARGIFVDVQRSSDLAGAIRDLAGTVRLAYRIEYTPPLREGTHSGTVSIRDRGGLAQIFNYTSGARPPRPTLHVTPAASNWLDVFAPTMTLDVDPGAQRPVRAIHYFVEGRPLATVQAEQAVQFRLSPGWPRGDRLALEARIDDGLFGQATAVAQTEAFETDQLALAAVWLVAGLGLIWLVWRRLAARRGRGAADAGTGLFLQPQGSRRWSTGGGPIALPRVGVLGRGQNAFGLDAADPFLASVSREHLRIEVRNGRLYTRPCSSNTVGTCVVDVVDRGSNENRRLPSDHLTEVSIGSQLLLGEAPADGFTERPTLLVCSADVTTVRWSAPIEADPDPGRTDAVQVEPWRS